MWKLPTGEWVATPASDTSSPPPATLLPAPRLQDDVHCLQQLFRLPKAPTRMIRCTKRAVVVYGFVDASTSGFGSTFELPDGALWYRQGTWGRDADQVSSNFRELCNLVESVEAGVASGELAQSELYIFTDNTTAEGAFHRGNSDNHLLFQLVLRLRTLEMHASLCLFVIHVAGTRMIQQGTDGLSRGLLMDGVFSGDSMSLHIPLHLSALERAPDLLPWVRSWRPDPSVLALTPADWYTIGHGLSASYTLNIDGIPVPLEHPSVWFLCAPPPAAARTTLAELAASRHKSPHLNHIVLLPRLFTSEWRRQLHNYLVCSKKFR
jgi:hypothetical protein